ncbi:hypothetical protein ANAEL_05964 [Anaerolineales bacterium]|nr:hypothetical protein ANAEL_05964 [Anaerolineales bacterium]
MRKIFLSILILFLAACVPAQPNTIDIENTVLAAAWTIVALTQTALPTINTPTLVATSMPIVLESPTPSPTFTSLPTFTPFPTFTPTATPTAVPFSQTSLRPAQGADAWVTPHYPELWSRLDRSFITTYPYNHFSDFAYAPNGDLWLVGGFGVIRQTPSGQQSWYSIQEGLPVNYFKSLAIAPNGEVWVGGSENALFRFDGREWRDEGQFLPPPLNSRTQWLCYSRNIFGIDFDQDGQIWVANAGLELYTRQNGQWIDFGFPKDLLPNAGGGGCPIGLRVFSPDRIMIARQGCCGNPDIAYHFDGQTWTHDLDLTDFTSHLAARRKEGKAQQYQAGYGNMGNSGFSWPFPSQQILAKGLHPLYGTFSYCSPASLAIDADDTIWINNDYDLFNNASGGFKDLGTLNGPPLEPDFSQVRWIDFPDDPLTIDSDSRFERFSRWFFGYNELGRNISEHLSRESHAVNDYPWLRFSLDESGQVWLYAPEQGLAVVRKDGVASLLPGPAELTLSVLGGVQPLPDGRVAVGSVGAVWILERGAWQKWVVPETTEKFIRFAQDTQGNLYAATDTSVYRIVHGEFQQVHFVTQDVKPDVLPTDSTKPPAYHKRYVEVGTAPELINHDEFPLHYRVLLLRVMPDGTVLYANSHVLALFNSKDWHSFLFEQIEFESVAVDSTGNLWAYAGYNGLLKFDLKVFQVYQGPTSP